ncbi:MAG: TIGR01777 family oxidoreductase [Desulfobulbaceae bacterium]|nr:TIGR01777 family oxidoreductase [Desulfobulbaceae bacterium]
MRIFITGGTGFVGSHLVQTLLQADHQLTILSRSGGTSSRPGLDYLKDDPAKPGEWQAIAAGHDAVINLAGASLFRPWTEKNKRMIRDSRILTTANISEALSRKEARASVLISASAVGYYGDRGNTELDEKAPPGSDFLARLAVEWEEQAEKCSAAGVRVVRCRFGIVLGADGGALEKMMPVFKLGLGTPLGPGDQWVSWIHIHDLVTILSYLLNTEKASGAINCTAPSPVTQKGMTSALADALHRPAFLPAVPAFVLKTVLGESSQMVLNSQKVVPGVLLEQGFSFTYPDMPSALRQIVTR